MKKIFLKVALFATVMISMPTIMMADGAEPNTLNDGYPVHGPRRAPRIQSPVSVSFNYFANLINLSFTQDMADVYVVIIEDDISSSTYEIGSVTAGTNIDFSASFSGEYKIIIYSENHCIYSTTINQ